MTKFWNRVAMRQTVGLVAGCAIAVAAPLLTAPTASASASGCTAVGTGMYHNVPNTTICIHVEGNGDYIDYISGHASSFTGVSNSQIRITGFDKHNHQTGQFSSGIHYGTMHEQYFAHSFKAHITNLRGGRVCASLWLNGKAYPGACESIH